MEKNNFKITLKNFGSNPNKLPFFCPREECRKITSTIDDKYLLNYGICSKCYIELIEDRKEPLIDVEFYKNRLKVRGY